MLINNLPNEIILELFLLYDDDFFFNMIHFINNIHDKKKIIQNFMNIQTKWNQNLLFFDLIEKKNYYFIKYLINSNRLDIENIEFDKFNFILQTLIEDEQYDIILHLYEKKYISKKQHEYNLENCIRYKKNDFFYKLMLIDNKNMGSNKIIDFFYKLMYVNNKNLDSKKIIDKSMFYSNEELLNKEFEKNIYDLNDKLDLYNQFYLLFRKNNHELVKNRESKIKDKLENILNFNDLNFIKKNIFEKNKQKDLFINEKNNLEKYNIYRSHFCINYFQFIVKCKNNHLIKLNDIYFNQYFIISDWFEFAKKNNQIYFMELLFENNMLEGLNLDYIFSKKNCYYSDFDILKFAFQHNSEKIIEYILQNKELYFDKVEKFDFSELKCKTSYQYKIIDNLDDYFKNLLFTNIKKYPKINLIRICKKYYPNLFENTNIFTYLIETNIENKLFFELCDEIKKDEYVSYTIINKYIMQNITTFFDLEKFDYICKNFNEYIFPNIECFLVKNILNKKIMEKNHQEIFLNLHKYGYRFSDNFFIFIANNMNLWENFINKEDIQIRTNKNIENIDYDFSYYKTLISYFIKNNIPVSNVFGEQIAYNGDIKVLHILYNQCYHFSEMTLYFALKNMHIECIEFLKYVCKINWNEECLILLDLYKNGKMKNENYTKNKDNQIFMYQIPKEHKIDE